MAAPNPRFCPTSSPSCAPTGSPEKTQLRTLSRKEGPASAWVPAPVRCRGNPAWCLPPMEDCQSLTREDWPQLSPPALETATPVGWEQLFYNLRTRSHSRESKGPRDPCPSRPHLLPGRDHTRVPLFILYLWQLLRALPKISWHRGPW